MVKNMLDKTIKWTEQNRLHVRDDIVNILTVTLHVIQFNNIWYIEYYFVYCTIKIYYIDYSPIS